MSRRTTGRPRKNVESATSSTDCAACQRTNRYGPSPVGDGPYRFVRWQAAQSVELVADSTFFLGRPVVRRLIWRLTPPLGGAGSQVIADQADVREPFVPP